MNKRASGVLMHITSLPNELGIGTFGKSAYEFVDFLVETNQTYWQILPLTTTSYGDSPYQSFSAIAGNINLIDFELLVEEKLLEKTDYNNVDFGKQQDKIEYDLLYKNRKPILELAVNNALKQKKTLKKIEEFKEENNSWLLDYAEFMAIKEHFDNKSLLYWDEDIRKAKLKSREKYRKLLKNKIDYYTITQYFFFSQWNRLKEYANKGGIKVIGDMPIYVSADSVEMWTMPELFKVDSNNKPLYVAGCPADDFSPEGQLWGNPIYDWEKHKKNSYSWWIYRIKESFKLYDVLRIDHFKGFSDYWQIKNGSTTAKVGTWEEGPGIELFETIKEKLGDLPIIAEDLGQIDDKTRKLLSDVNYPGMKVLQFAFSGEDNIYLPHNYIRNSIAYVGTHDNDVTNSWYENLDKNTKKRVDDYLNIGPKEKITEVMIRSIHSSVSKISIITIQDLLNKDGESRMNMPSTVGGNWEWRMKKGEIKKEHKEFLEKITTLYARGRTKNETSI